MYACMYVCIYSIFTSASLYVSPGYVDPGSPSVGDVYMEIPTSDGYFFDFGTVTGASPGEFRHDRGPEARNVGL